MAPNIEINHDMKTIRRVLFLVAILCWLMPVAASAQKKKARPATAKKETTSKKPANAVFNQLLQGTAQVMFIDSMVVDFDDFVRQIPLNRESGTLTSTAVGATFANEFDNRKFYSRRDTAANGRLYTTDRLGENWDSPRLISELEDGFSSLDYPFLLSDGITLFFSAKGTHGVGGYDLYMTRFDADNGQFYQPENYGLPFNSEANDYLIAIDELDTLAWLVSDRHQPEGKVCIYVYEPTAQRLMLNDTITGALRMNYAQLNNIRDTWIFGDRSKALARLERLRKRLQDQPKETTDMFFVINDRHVYTSPDDFRNSNNRLRYQQLRRLQQQIHRQEHALRQQRDAFHAASAAQRQQLSAQILQTEEQLEQLYLQEKQLVKDIRNKENLMYQ